MKMIDQLSIIIPQTSDIRMACRRGYEVLYNRTLFTKERVLLDLLVITLITVQNMTAFTGLLGNEDVWVGVTEIDQW